MKKTIVATVVIAFLLTSSCSKTDKVCDKQNTKYYPGLQSQFDFTNPDNDYEFFGEYLKNMLLYVNSTQQDSGQAFPEFDEYWPNFNDFMDDNPFDFQLSSQGFSVTENDFFNSIVNLIDESDDFENYTDNISVLENSIISGEYLNNDQKIRLLAFSSLQKFYIHTSLVDILIVGEIEFPRAWEDFYDDCMKTKLNSFNWVEWTAFVAAMPTSYVWLVASCTYEATRAYRDSNN